MNIELKQADGCDKISRIYEELFNVLQNVIQDNNSGLLIPL